MPSGGGAPGAAGAVVTSAGMGGTPMTAGGFERLADEGLIKSNFNVVHGNDIAPATIGRIVAAGGTFTSTAEIELQMGYGHPVTGTLRALGAPMSIGTDVEAASRGDMFTAMRVTLQHERNRAITETEEYYYYYGGSGQSRKEARAR